MSNKAALREHFLRVREQITEDYRQQAALSAANFLTSHPLFKNSRHIACYYPFRSEFETKPIIEAIWHAEKKCYLPVLCEGKTLSFVRYEPGDELEVNQFDILEPFDFSKKIVLEKLELVIMPLVAFDARGRRLGTGGGYYDRTFAFVHTHKHRTKFMGLGYMAQHADLLPDDPWDIHLNGVITDKEIKEF